MALGIDIYRYQTVTDWAAVKRHGVKFVYVKGTDGGGRAQARADGQVAGAKSVGLPVGLYHYAQLSPTPEAQADILLAEVRRLGALGMPPALDLEDPFRPDAHARQFAQRFLTRLRAHGVHVMLYANTSMLIGIGADTLNIQGLRIWAANYGRNDGKRYPFNYRGRVDIHQYTSVGTVPGITGLVDLNESLTTTLGGSTVSTDDVVQSWYGPRFRDGRNYAQVIHNIEDLSIISNAKVDAVTKVVTALANDPDLDENVVREIMRNEMAAAVPAIASQAAKAITADLRPELLELLGSDNEEQADAFLSKLAERLTSVGADETEGDQG